MKATKNFQDGFKSFEEAQKVANKSNTNVHLYTMGADGEWFDEALAVTKNGKTARVIKLHPTHDESKNFSWTLGVPVK